MQRLGICLALAAFAGSGPAWAFEIDPGLRAKAVAAAAPATPAAPAASTKSALPELALLLPLEGRTFSGACESASTDVCYNHKEGRIVIRSTRQWMPELPGMRAEHIALRRDRIVLRYSFP